MSELGLFEKKKSKAHYLNNFWFLEVSSMWFSFKSALDILLLAVWVGFMTRLHLEYGIVFVSETGEGKVFRPLYILFVNLQKREKLMRLG